MWELWLKAWYTSMGPLEVEAVQSWPTLALKSRSKFKLCAARRKDLKGKGKGKSDVGPIHRPVDSNPSSVLVVPASEAEDSAASFQGPSDVSDHHRVQPMRQAKLLRVPIVDSDIDHHWCFPKAAVVAAAVRVEVVPVLRMMILRMMMCTCLAALQ